MPEPTPTKTTVEKYNDLLNSLDAQLKESSHKKLKEYFELVAVSDEPEKDNKDFCPNKFGADVKMQLHVSELYAKYEKLKKAFDDSVNESKEASDKGKDQAEAKEALEKFILEDLMGNPHFAGKFNDEFEAVKKAKEAMDSEKSKQKLAIESLQKQLEGLNNVASMSTHEHEASKIKLEGDLKNLQETEISKEDLDKAKEALFKAVTEGIVKPELMFNLGQHIINARQFIEHRDWQRSEGRDGVNAFCSEDAIRLRKELEKLNDFIVKLGEEKEDAKEEDLNELQNLEQEINSYLSAKAEDKDSASKDKDTKPSFSERVKSGFETAMNYLKQNQNKLRYIAGGLLATVAIYNIVAAFAGFNAFALMASIATLTSTLPLVLAAVEIALITFAGTSLIAYTATNDKVRKACSIVDLKEEPLTNKPSGSNSRVEGAPTPR